MVSVLIRLSLEGSLPVSSDRVKCLHTSAPAPAFAFHYKLATFELFAVSGEERREAQQANIHISTP